MAAPISFHANPRDLRAADYEQLKNAPREHAEALLSAYQLLQALHDEGMLDVAKGVIGSRDKLLQVMVDAGALPETVRGIRNLIILAKIAGSLDPKALEGVARAIPEGMAAANSPTPPSFWSMLKMLFSTETRRALGALICMLQSFGRTLRPEDQVGEKGSFNNS